MGAIRGHRAELDEGVPSRIGAFGCFGIQAGAQGDVVVEGLLIHATLIDGSLGMPVCFVGE